ncbi:MAG: hypothetical protein ACRCWR_11815 [Saezia sp.]
MKVKAREKGFYRGKIIYPDEVFEVDDKAKAKWFDALDEKRPTSKEVKEPRAAKAK